MHQSVFSAIERRIHMAFVSLVPHSLTVLLASGEQMVIEPSGSVARCSQREEFVRELDGVHVTRQVFGDVEGLPPREEGTFFIVSRLVASAAPERDDLLIPGPLVRDGKGVVVGCKGLSVL